MHKWHVLGALALATAALGVLSIQAVRREAAARRDLVEKAHRGVADLVSARLSANLAEDAQAIGAAVQKAGPHADAIVDALDALEAARPWLAPLVVIPSPNPSLSSNLSIEGQPSEAAPRQSAFDALLQTAEREEFARKRFDSAVPAYAKAAAEAPSTERRLAAMNGMARTELNAGHPGRAADTYQRIVSAADALDAGQARWALLARSQLIECDALAGNPDAQRRHTLALNDFVIRFRYMLDHDAVAFYTQRVADVLEHAEFTPEERATRQRLLDRESSLARLDEAIRSAGQVRTGSPAAVAYPLQPHVTGSLERVLHERGPWSDLGVALLDDTGHQVFSSVEPRPSDATAATSALPQPASWRVQVFPKSGSLTSLAARDVTRYALWLVLVFGTVVTALALAARSVSRELALARLRAEFVASVSHELKTPLSLIRMFGESLREGWVPEPQKQDYYEVITRESERLTGLINNVLDFSRLESGTRRYSFDTIDLRKLIEDLLDRYEFHLRAANIELVRALSTEPVHARADHDAIEQVLVNLLSNAVKYIGAPERMPRQVRVSLDREASQVVLRVSDTGIGMSDSERPHIFERFYRSDDERVRAVAGSGLGLTLVKAHVDAHAGAIQVDSTPGRGTTFAISLPLTPHGAQS